VKKRWLATANDFCYVAEFGHGASLCEFVGWLR